MIYVIFLVLTFLVWFYLANYLMHQGFDLSELPENWWDKCMYCFTFPPIYIMMLVCNIFKRDKNAKR